MPNAGPGDQCHQLFSDSDIGLVEAQRGANVTEYFSSHYWWNGLSNGIRKVWKFCLHSPYFFWCMLTLLGEKFSTGASAHFYIF